MSDATMRASTELAGMVPEVWSAKIYPTLLQMLPFNDSVSRDYEGEIQNLGDTVHINDFPQFDPAVEILEDERADADAISANTQDLVINKQVVKDFIITKKATLQSIDSMDKLRDLAIYSLMKRMQQIIIDATVPSAATPDHQIAYDSGTTLALADILEAKELLDSSDVEEIGRICILGAAQQNDLFNITGFTSRDYIPAGSPLTTGTFPTPVLGFQVKWTTVVGNTSRFFNSIYLTLAIQQNPDVRMYDLGVDGKRGTRVNTDILFGVKQLSDVRVVSVS